MNLLSSQSAAALAAAIVLCSTPFGPSNFLGPPPAFAEQAGRGAIDAQGRLPAAVAAQESPNAVDLRTASPRVTSRCYLDVGIGGEPAGRLVIDLFGELCPRAAENFRALCTGEKGFGYAGSNFYRVVAGFTVQGGEIAGSPGGAPGRSIDGPTFEHDNYAILHNVPGLVSMVNTAVGGGGGLRPSQSAEPPRADRATISDGPRRRARRSHSRAAIRCVPCAA